MIAYPLKNTALIVVDPFNDFLSEGGKLWSFTKETVEGAGVVKNLASLLAAARVKKIQGYLYTAPSYTKRGDYLNWKFLAPSHAGSKENNVV